MNTDHGTDASLGRAGPGQNPQTPDWMPLSIHSPSSSHRSASEVVSSAQRTWRGRLNMLLVMLICAAPVVASYVSYYIVRPTGRTNHGDLIDPPVPMPPDEALVLHDLSGKSVALSSLKGQWLFITVAGGQCDTGCEHQLYLQRQIREALGKEKDRVDRVWIIQDGQPMRGSLVSALKGAWVLQADAKQLSAWLKPDHGHQIDEHWYLVDPRGQWMMRFQPKTEPRLVYKDLMRLLNAAGPADEAGRP